MLSLFNSRGKMGTLVIGYTEDTHTSATGSVACNNFLTFLKNYMYAFIFQLYGQNGHITSMLQISAVVFL